MGYPKKRIRAKRSRKRKTTTRRKRKKYKIPKSKIGQSIVSRLKVWLPLVLLTLLIAFLHTPYLVLHDLTDESNELEQFIGRFVSKSTGLFISIEKTEEPKISFGRKYSYYELEGELDARVDLTKWINGVKNSLPSKFNIKGEKIKKKRGSRILRARIYYQSLLFCSLQLRQIIGRKVDVPKPSARASQKTKKQPVRPVPTEAQKVVSPVPVKKTINVRVQAPVSNTGPRIAFVIDDVGNNNRYTDIFFSLPREITPAILPQLRYSGYFAREARQRGFDVMIHLPLEAENGNINPGPGTILTSMSAEDAIRTFYEDLQTVPGAVGINNHMGSKATSDYGLMNVLLPVIKKENMFFLDSYTTAGSVIAPIMQRLNLTYVKRDVFLDNNNDPAYIKDQMYELMRIAQEKGTAIGIGHYRRNTLRVISEMIPVIEKKGIRIVRVRDIVR